MSTDWAVTTRALLGVEAAARLWPEHLASARTVLEARDRLRAKARSFWLASTLLPAGVRDDLAVLYAFCREADDIADEGEGGAPAAERLDRLRDELLGVAPARPLVVAFRAAATRRRIPLGSALTLLEGVRGDLDPVRVSDDPELLRYCYRVGGTVGLMLCAVLRTDPNGAPHAVDLGVAMQLTNIVRDVVEDAAHGRIYLPSTRLAASGISPDDLLSGRADPEALTRVLFDLLALADTYYRSADAGMRHIPALHRTAILVASRAYRAIGVRARTRGHSPLRGRVIVPAGGKARCVASAIAHSVSPDILGLTGRRPHDDALHAAFEGWPGTARRAASPEGCA